MNEWLREVLENASVQLQVDGEEVACKPHVLQIQNGYVYRYMPDLDYPAKWFVLTIDGFPVSTVEQRYRPGDNFELDFTVTFD